MTISVSNIVLAPQEQKPPVVKSGWLFKRRFLFKQWSSRYFELRPGVLTYFKGARNEKKTFRDIPLSQCKIRVVPKYGPYSIELTPMDHRRAILSGSSKEELDGWLSAISEHCSVVIVDPPILKEIPAAKKMTPNDYEFIKVLGKGNYGKVMLARKLCTSGMLYAIKIVKKSVISNDGILAHIISEKNILQMLNNPYFVTLYHSFQTPDRLYLVMEYIGGGELFFHIGKEKIFSEARVRIYGAEILWAIQFLHDNGVVYRDLKLENILLSEDGHIKISDFGLCKEGIGLTMEKTDTFCGTPEYLAPEILEEANYGKSVDWWAFGIVLYELLTGRAPFGKSNSIEALFDNILSQAIVFPGFLSPQAISLLSGLLERDYTKRLGCRKFQALEIMSHPFFREINWEHVKMKELVPPFKPVIKNQYDVENFDKHFTSMPAILTPQDNILTNEYNYGEITIENFSYSREGNDDY